MPLYENITGDKILDHIQAMITDKSFIQVTLPEYEYDNLTVVTDVIDDGNQQFFIIDSPEGLQRAIGQTGADRLFFEFTGDDRVTHRFNASIASVSLDSILCELPAYIERHQQRNNFRVKTPYQSFAALSLENEEIRMDIDNVSLGGVYCYCDKRFKPLFEVKSKIQDMELSFTLRDECFLIPIQRAVVNRIESHHQRRRQFGIAFEFIKIDREARRQLVQRIYELQREFLKNRLKVMD